MPKLPKLPPRSLLVPVGDVIDARGRFKGRSPVGEVGKIPELGPVSGRGEKFGLGQIPKSFKTDKPSAKDSAQTSFSENPFAGIKPGMSKDEMLASIRSGVAKHPLGQQSLKQPAELPPGISKWVLENGIDPAKARSVIEGLSFNGAPATENQLKYYMALLRQRGLL